MRGCLRILSLILVAAVLVVPSLSRAQASDPGREFMMSCVYGTMAGTLIGAASLAFVDRPADNMNKVARGASLGLYAGILLGAYIVYGVPDGGDDMDDPVATNTMMILPTLNDLGNIDGAQAQFNLLSF